MNKIFYSIFITFLFLACTYNETDVGKDGGIDMHWTKSVTGTLISKQNGKFQLQESFHEAPGNYTAQFLVSKQLGALVTPVAQILWSAGGNTSPRLVSVFDGLAITGFCEHVTINVSDVTDPIEVAPPSQYDVTVLVGRGVRASISQPPIYQTYITFNGATILGAIFLTAGSTFDIVMPQNAGVNSVMVTASIIPVAGIITAADCVVEQHTVTRAVKNYFPNDYDFVPISPQVSFIRLKNLSGVDIELSITWGIDG